MKHLVLVPALLFTITLHAQWQNLGSGISTSNRKIFSISAADENNVWAIAFNPSGAAAFDFTRSTDGGAVWNAGTLPNVGAYYPGHIHAVDDQTAWVIMINTPQQDRIKILKTTDGGVNWQDQPGGFNTAGFAFACLHFFNGNEGIGFGSPGTDDAAVDSLRIYHTMDGGDNWMRIPAASLPPPAAGEGQWAYGNNRYEEKGDTLWFCTRAGRVFRTTDKGITWQAFDTGFMGSGGFSGVASIAFENNLRGIVTSYQPSQAARTEDGGETWTPISIPSSPPAGDIEHVPGTVSTYFVNEGYLNSSNTASPYLITHDAGDTWQSVTYTPAVPVITFLSPTVGFAGARITSPTQGGLYAWVGGNVGIGDAVSEDLSTLIFPNPNEGDFTVRIDPRATSVDVQVIDATGRAVLSERIATSNGTVQVRATSTLSSGLYTVRINDGDRIHQSQLIVQ